MSYKINENAVISFSGGRTSAFMLYHILREYDFKLPDHLRVCFANTGKEMPQTLDFVRDCGQKWGVDIIWLECNARKGVVGENKYVYETKIVDYETASRNGEPFESLIKARNYLPNPVARFCTQELKILRMRDYMNTQFDKGDWINVIGIRYDEPRRWSKMQYDDTRMLPLVSKKITKQHVYDFWKGQDFDLQLYNNNGVTDWGNCDLCFLKARAKKQHIINVRPQLADWWIKMEKEIGATFRKDGANYEQMKNNIDMLQIDPNDETIPCFCGD